jgi:biotin-(acetyl-CoA carboxylase) ligase
MFMDKFQIYYSRWQKEDSFDSIKNRWLEFAYNLNKDITLDDGMRKVSGIFRGIDNEGAIRVELVNGELCSFSSGQVTYL